MAFDPSTWPLSGTVELCQESGFNEHELVAMGLLNLLRNLPAVAYPFVYSGMRIDVVEGRPKVLHIHARGRNGMGIDHVATADDVASWSQIIAREMWGRGHYRMPSD